MTYTCAAWVDMITHVHNVGFLSLDAESHSHFCSVGLGVCNDFKDSLLALLPALIPCPGLFSASLCLLSILYLLSLLLGP